MDWRSSQPDCQIHQHVQESDLSEPHQIRNAFGEIRTAHWQFRALSCKKMIITKWSRKDPSFQQLFEYMEKGSAKGLPIIKHNLLGYSKQEIIHEFQKNAELIKSRRNGNYLYHIILSIHPSDKPLTPPEIMEDLGLKCIEIIVQDKALAVGMIHMTKNPHIHYMVSANQIGLSKKLNLSKKDFFQMRRKIEAYQQAKYPFLKNSIVFLEREFKRPQIQKTRGEHERDRRLQKEGHTLPRNPKEVIRSVVESCLRRTNGEVSFNKILEKYGFSFYLRGKTPGVTRLEDDKNFRLKTLGLLEVYQETHHRWKRIKERRGIIEDLRLEREKYQKKNKKMELGIPFKEINNF